MCQLRVCQNEHGLGMAVSTQFPGIETARFRSYNSPQNYKYFLEYANFEGAKSEEIYKKRGEDDPRLVK